MKNCLSIDWEDWFHVCEVEHIYPRRDWDTFPSILEEATDKILELLNDKGVRGTFFMLGYCAARHPKLVRRIANQGHEVACHSFSHQLVYESDPEAFAVDLTRGKKLLEDLSGQAVRGFRAPQWSLNHRAAWAVDQLIAAGFEYDSSRAPLPIVGRSDSPEEVHLLPSANGKGRLVELPPLVFKTPWANLPAGGGWGLRTWPIRAIVGKASRLNAKGSPATFFIHPAEFMGRRRDSRLPWKKRFVLNFGLRRTEEVLDRLFEHLTLAAAADVLDELEAATVQEVGL